MANDNNVVSGGAAQGTTISNFLLDVRYDCTLGHLAERENIANGQICFLSSIDELSGMHALVRDKRFCPESVPVWIAEGDFGQRGTTAGVVDDFLDDATDVSMSLGVLGMN